MTTGRGRGGEHWFAYLSNEVRVIDCNDVSNLFEIAFQFLRGTTGERKVLENRV